MKTRFAFITLILVVASSMLYAGVDRPVPHKEKTVIIYSDTKIGDTVLPKGEYEVKHVLEGTDNVLVFTSGRKDYRFKCQLKPTTDKVDAVALQFHNNPDGSRSLVSVTFPGDASAHVF